jgi:4-hydroxy-3-methylbut-2-enyl diphosphate reductase
MQILLAQPRGFCAGVVRAIEIVERALERYPHPIYVLHEIVHNRYVVDDLKNRGAVFVETLDEVPTGSVCIFSAHGVATTIVKQAEDRDLEVIDATCPLVTKVHTQAQRYANKGYELVIIGHPGHPEVEGTRGCIDGKVQVLCSVDEVMSLQVTNPDKLAYVTQTTLSVDDTRDVIEALQQRFPNVQGPDVNDICYATQNRQNAVRDLTKSVEILLVVGAQNSSNSNRLREVGAFQGVQSYLIQDETDLKRDWFHHQAKVGITAGASAPEILVDKVLNQLKVWGVRHIKTMDGEEETTVFKIPAALL